MKIVVFGANGPVGKLLVEQALAEQHEVRAVTRHPESFPIQGDTLTVLAGDVFNADDVSRAVEGQDIVLSLVGVPYTRKPVTVYSAGTTNMINAMHKAGVRRFIGVTSGGTCPHWSPTEGIVFGFIIKPFIGRTLYADMRRMENIVMASDLDWTIARPAQLVDGSTVSSYRVAEEYFIPGMSKTARIDLADFMLKEAANPHYIRKAVAVATPKR